MSDRTGGPVLIGYLSPLSARNALRGSRSFCLRVAPSKRSENYTELYYLGALVCTRTLNPWPSASVYSLWKEESIKRRSLD
jgi:hypothetical protein